jgi:hypothetical protein
MCCRQCHCFRSSSSSSQPRFTPAVPNSVQQLKKTDGRKKTGCRQDRRRKAMGFVQPYFASMKSQDFDKMSSQVNDPAWELPFVFYHVIDCTNYVNIEDHIEALVDASHERIDKILCESKGKEAAKKLRILRKALLIQDFNIKVQWGGHNYHSPGPFNQHCFEGLMYELNDYIIQLPKVKVAIKRTQSIDVWKQNWKRPRC